MVTLSKEDGKKPLLLVPLFYVSSQEWYGNHIQSGISSYEILHTLAEEWNLPLPEGLPATEAAEELFNLIMRRLKWIE